MARNVWDSIMRICMSMMPPLVIGEISDVLAIIFQSSKSTVAKRFHAVPSAWKRRGEKFRNRIIEGKKGVRVL